MYLIETCLSTSWNWHFTPQYVLLNSAVRLYEFTRNSRYFGYQKWITEWLNYTVTSRAPHRNWLVCKLLDDRLSHETIGMTLSWISGNHHNFYLKPLRWRTFAIADLCDGGPPPAYQYFVYFHTKTSHIEKAQKRATKFIVINYLFRNILIRIAWYN